MTFQDIGASTFRASAQGANLTAQGLVSVPEQLTFQPLATSTFAVPSTHLRHVQATFLVTNRTGLTLDNLKFFPAVPQGGNGTTFRNLTYFDGSSAAAKASSLVATQGQVFDLNTLQVHSDPSANPLVTGLDVSGLDLATIGASSVSSSGWQVAGRLAPGASAPITFAADMPMDPTGSSRDPFSFSVVFTSVQDGVTLTSVVPSYNRVTRSFGATTRLPTMTDNGVTHSLPTYFDLKNVDRTGAAQPVVVCPSDGNTLVQPLIDPAHPGRFRVEVTALGSHTLNVYAGTSCSGSGSPLLTQTVTGVLPARVPLATGNRSLYNLTLQEDGQVQAWGSNVIGQLGDGTTVNRLVPVAVTGLQDVLAVAANGAHSLALQRDGTVQIWGSKGGSNATTPIPQVFPGLSGVVSLAAGGGFTLALRADGTVWAWGSGSSGQLGNGQMSYSATPVMVQGLHDVVSVSAGDTFSLALAADGTAWAWGNNAASQLGNGNSTDSAVPVRVSGLQGATQLAAGAYHALALMSDGTVQAWGSNINGELGDNTFNNGDVPAPVLGLTGVTSVSAGFTHSLALASDGRTWEWGYKEDQGTSNFLPALVPGLNDVVGIASGESHNLALKADGTVQAWGLNYDGQLGNGTTTSSRGPAAVFINGVAQPLP
ncbi:RCC1 domain-containing protein [Deinococcus altitudinis]|uniref:RCC1 domain-containing protein n=1 Tax=Deinococcus altitudinis TaxID=468914 RepID=UPI003892A873